MEGGLWEDVGKMKENPWVVELWGESVCWMDSGVNRVRLETEQTGRAGSVSAFSPAMALQVPC